MKFAIILAICVASTWAKNVPVLSRNKAPRIIGGTVARAGQFPFMAALNIQTADGRFFCGGALISNEWIISSATCLQGATVVTIHLGSNTLTGTDPNRVTLSSSNVIVHPDFDPDSQLNDIALVELRLPVELDDYIEPIRLAVSNLPNSAKPTAIGWGQISDDDGDLSTSLRFVGLAVVPNNECSNIYGSPITNGTVCVEGNYNEGTCFGDTGGPLVVRMIGSTFLQHVGVASFFSGNGCETEEPSGYTRTYYHIDWIRNVTGIET